jgi:hypothetical protein
VAASLLDFLTNDLCSSLFVLPDNDLIDICFVAKPPTLMQQQQPIYGHTAAAHAQLQPAATVSSKTPAPTPRPSVTSNTNGARSADPAGAQLVCKKPKGKKPVQEWHLFANTNMRNNLIRGRDGTYYLLTDKGKLSACE